MKNTLLLPLFFALLVSAPARAENTPDVQKKIQQHEMWVKHFQKLAEDAKGRRKGDVINKNKSEVIPALEKKIGEARNAWNTAMEKARAALQNYQIDPTNAAFYNEYNRTKNEVQKARVALEDLQEDLDDANDELNSARKSYAKYDLKKQEYELEVKQHLEAIAFLKSGKTSADRQKEIEGKAAAELKSKEEEVKSVQTTYEAEIAKLKKQVASLQSQLKKSKSSLAACQGATSHQTSADHNVKNIEGVVNGVGTGTGTGSSVVDPNAKK